MFIITDEQWNQGIHLDEYNGTFSLISAKQKEDGRVFDDWCKVRKGQDAYTEKDLPMGVRLGDKEQAVEVLKQFIKALEGGGGQPEKENDDIPF